LLLSLSCRERVRESWLVAQTVKEFGDRQVDDVLQ
jgi:hypothetical protein